jgi:hypothetical protein
MGEVVLVTNVGEEVLRAGDCVDYTGISLQPTREGWTGTARPQGGGYRCGSRSISRG